VDAFYARRYRQLYHGEEVPSARRVYRAWRNGQRLVQLLRPYLRETDHVLEVGAGIGCTVRAFERAGFLAAGIEPHEGFSQYARQHLGVQVVTENLYQYTPASTWDVILLVHVIEHLRDPVVALQRLASWTGHKGRLYVECPNLAAPFAAPGKWFHLAHIYNFIPVTLAGIAARAGWRVERWLSGPRDNNLAVLLTADSKAQVPDYSHGYQEVVAALRRYSWWTYHLRASYLRQRMRKLAGYVWEYLVADRVVATLCETPSVHRRQVAARRVA